MAMQRLSTDKMTGPEFEAYVGEILRYHGYLVEATRVTGDCGVDLVARRYAEILAVQCKRLASPVGAKAVEQVAAGAAAYGCTSTMVVTNQSFSAAAIAVAKRLFGVLEKPGHHLSSVLRGFGLTADVIRDRLTCAELSIGKSFEADAEALLSIGIDLRAIRDTIDRTFGASTYDSVLPKYGRRRRGHIPFTKPAKKVLELSLREALAHKDNWIGCEHIVLGILRGGDKFTLGLITEHVDTAQLRATVVGLLDQAA